MKKFVFRLAYCLSVLNMDGKIAKRVEIIVLELDMQLIGNKKTSSVHDFVQLKMFVY